MGRRCTDLIGWLGSVLVAGLLIGVAEWPYQWLSEAGFWLHALWPLGGGAPRSPLLAALPLVGTALFMALAWGPFAAGRGGGITGILVLQDNQEQPLQERALASLSLQRQLVRLPLLALTHLAGLSVGTESPSAALGASILLALRGRLAPLRKLPPALVAAIGEGAGLGAAFCSPLLGAAYALEEFRAPARLPGGQPATLEPALLPLAALAVVSGGLSLNDGSLSLGAALQGEDGAIPWWAALPRLGGLPPEQRAALAGVRPVRVQSAERAQPASAAAHRIGRRRRPGPLARGDHVERKPVGHVPAGLNP